MKQIDHKVGERADTKARSGIVGLDDISTAASRADMSFCWRARPGEQTRRTVAACAGSAPVGVTLRYRFRCCMRRDSARILRRPGGAHP